MNILISGGSGAFGTAFCRYLLTKDSGYKRIAVLSRGEWRQHQLKLELEPLDKDNRMRYMIGDVRDRDRLRRAFNGVTHVVHAAALKRIEVGHYNPLEMVHTNIGGATNVIEAAQDAGVGKVVFLSSDKAFEPVSPYGLSKAMAESLFLAANNITGATGPRFAVTRYGNVWNSTGSVVPIWRRLIHSGETELPVTDPECTRFFMRMREAIELVLDTFQRMDSEKSLINIPILPAYRLGDLAMAIGAKSMRITGLPSWEKCHESMCKDRCSADARRMTVEELRHELDNTPL